MENNTISTTDTKLVYTVEDIQKIFGIGKTCAYRLMNSDGFPSFTLNKRLYVEKEMFLQWMRSNVGKVYTY